MVRFRVTAMQTCDGTSDATLQLVNQADPIRAVSSDTFDALVLQGNGPIVVEFMSYGCAHCRVLEPVLQRVATAVKSKETIFRLNIAVEHDLASSYDVHSTPTLVMFLDGTEVGRAEGPMPNVSSVLTAVTQPFET